MKHIFADFNILFQEVYRMNPGSPFKFGSLSSVILTICMTAMMIYFYLVDAGRVSSQYLLFITLGIGGSIRGYVRYRKLQFQQGREFIGDRP